MLFCNLLSFLVIAIFVHQSYGNIYTSRSIQEKQERYDRYVDCVNGRQASIEKWGNQRPFKALIVQRYSNIKLQCFQCLPPEDEDNIEEMWKPNDSFFGRTLRFITDKLKKFIADHGDKSKNKESTTFRWEHLKPNQSQWTSVIDLEEPIMPSAKAKKIVKGFLKKKESKVEIGDHYELEIFKAVHGERTGFYRCFRTSSQSINGAETNQYKIESLYYVDVFTNILVEVKEVEDDQASTLKTLPILDDLIEAKWMKSKWGLCNRCGNDNLGEQRRKVECVVQPKTSTSIEALMNSEVAFLTMFEYVPCLSSLLPLKYRTKLQAFAPIEEFRGCHSLCALPNNETRIIKDIDDSGKEFVSDELPPNEYSIAERLPPLKPSVIRKTIQDTETNSLVLDCGITDGDVLWRKDFKDVYSKDLYSQDPNTFRRYINSEGQFIFQKLETSDAGFYSCFTTPNTLQRTFRLYISETNQTEEIISYIKIVMRYVTGIFIAVLIIRTILKTNATAEHHHRIAPKK